MDCQPGCRTLDCYTLQTVFRFIDRHLRSIMTTRSGKRWRQSLKAVIARISCSTLKWRIAATKVPDLLNNVTKTRVRRAKKLSKALRNRVDQSCSDLRPLAGCKKPVERYNSIQNIVPSLMLNALNDGHQWLPKSSIRRQNAFVVTYCHHHMTSNDKHMPMESACNL